MKWQWTLLLSCVLAIVGGTVSLAATIESPWVCCNEPKDCGGGGFVCCPDEIMGMPPCNGDQPGYCVSVCIRPGGDDQPTRETR